MRVIKILETGFCGNLEMTITNKIIESRKLFDSSEIQIQQRNTQQSSNLRIPIIFLEL